MRSKNLAGNISRYEIAARALLRKVGGSYIFIHQLLLHYFATVETPAASKDIVGSAPGAYLPGVAAFFSTRHERIK